MTDYIMTLTFLTYRYVLRRIFRLDLIVNKAAKKLYNFFHLVHTDFTVSILLYLLDFTTSCTSKNNRKK